MMRLAIAQRAAALSTRALSAALAATGGPFGLLITVLGAAAIAWGWYKQKQEEATANAAANVQKSTGEIIASLDKENEKLRERIELAKKAGMTSVAQEGGEAVERLAEISALLDAERALVAAGKGDALQVINLTAVYNDLNASIQRTAGSKSELANINAGTSISDWLAKNTQYLSEAERIQAALKKARDELKVDVLPPEIEKRIRASFGKEATKDIENATKAAKEFIVSLEDEHRAIGATEQQQRMMAAARAAAKAPTKELRLQIMETAVAVDRESQAWKDAEAARKVAEEAISQDAETMLQLQERARGLEREIELHGKTAEAAVMAEAAKVRATASSLAISEEYRAELVKQAEEIERIAGLTKKKTALDEEKKLNDERLSAQKQLWGDIERTAHDTFISIFDSGKSAFDRLKDALKNGLYELLYQMTVKKWIIDVQASTSGGSGGTSALDSLSSMFGGSGSGGNSSSMDSLFSLFGKSGSASSSGSTSAMSGAASTAGAFAAAAMIGRSLGNAISQGYATNVTSSKSMVNWNTLLSPVPILGGILGGVINRAFGRKEKEFDPTVLKGSLGGGAFAGNFETAWTQKGGWFHSDRSGVDKQAVDAATSAALVDAYKAIQDATAGYAAVLGLNANAIKDRAQSLSITLGKDEEANQKAIAEFFVGVGNTIAGELLPEIGKFQAQGEAASATLQRLATGYSTIEQALWSIGMSFGAVGTASLEARERLLAAAGGIEAFAANTAGFQQNFLSEAERNAPVLKMVTEQMTALGLASVDTRDEFKQVVLGLDLTTEAGAKQYGALMNLQAAFAQVYPATEAATKALQERASLQEELDQLTMTSVQLLARQRDALDESNRPLFDQIQALKESRAALEAQAEAQRSATQAAQDRGANLLSGVDSMFSALQSVVSREKSLLEQSANAHRALSQALRGTLDSMSVAGRELEERQSARAQVQAALAIAKAGGVLPDADSLRGALSVLSKDASSMFATQQDYLRDFYSTQNDIAALAGLTDDALSVEEKSLKALDGMLESAQQQINALKGIDYSVLTLAQAISGFQGALGAAKADPVASAGGSVAKLYQELLGRAADSAGLDYWQNAVAGGMTLDQVRKLMMEGAEYKGIPGFASGGMFGGGLRIVGENGPELEATGPSRIWSANQTAALLSRAGSGDNAALVAEIRALRTEVQGLKSAASRTADASEKTAGNTGQLAEQIDNVTDGGNAMRADVFNVVRTKEVA